MRNRTPNLAWITLALGLSAVATVGCEKDESDRAPPTQPLRDDASVEERLRETLDDAKDALDKARAEITERYGDRLVKIDREIESLEERARDATGEARERWDAAIRDLRSHRETLSEKLSEYRSATGDAAAELEKGLERAASELDEAYREALRKLKDSGAPSNER